MAALKLFKQKIEDFRSQKIEDFSSQQHAAEKEQAAFPKPIVVTGFQALHDQDEIEGNFDDEDYIDMRKPVLRRSK